MSGLLFLRLILQPHIDFCCEATLYIKALITYHLHILLIQTVLVTLMEQLTTLLIVMKMKNVLATQQMDIQEPNVILAVKVTVWLVQLVVSLPFFNHLMNKYFKQVGFPT